MTWANCCNGSKSALFGSNHQGATKLTENSPKVCCFSSAYQFVLLMYRSLGYFVHFDLGLKVQQNICNFRWKKFCSKKFWNSTTNQIYSASFSCDFHFFFNGVWYIAGWNSKLCWKDEFFSSDFFVSNKTGSHLVALKSEYSILLHL